ncbi:MAG: 4-hydroxy-tetrahydrodipicolinate synthase, partial [Acidobacteriota bacterium]
MFQGAITALATPMRGGEVDLPALEELCERQIAEGIDGLVPCGSTGEAATLSHEEQAAVMRTVVQQSRGRVPVIAGAGSNATPKAIALSRMAAEAGVDGLLQVTPFYNKPTQPGLLAHYRAIAEATSLPIVLYNVPSRTGCDLLPETIAKAAEIPRVVGVKEATGNLARGQAVIAAVAGRDGFSILSGDDPTCVGLCALGGHGVISVVSNLAPGATAKLIAAAREGRLEEARALHYRLLPLMELMGIESNPIPVKAALSLLGIGANEVR